MNANRDADIPSQTARLLAEAEALLESLRADRAGDNNNAGDDDTSGSSGVRVPRPASPTAPALSASARVQRPEGEE